MADGDQIETLDALRRRGRVVWSRAHGWMVLGHHEARTVLEQHDTFSNRVSRNLSVPNGMDPPEHSRYRPLVDRFFDSASMAAFRPRCEELVTELIDSLPRGTDIDAVTVLGEELALWIQVAFVGWPPHLTGYLRQWVRSNREATRSGDRGATERVAEEFAVQVQEILDQRLGLGADAPNDATTALLRSRVDGRPLEAEEITSILRNWTMGEVGTITAAVGVIVHHLAAHRDVQDRLRARPEEVSAAVDEMLRIDGPLMANRRVATREVELGGKRFEEGDPVTIMWPSVNRDEEVFGDPDRFAPEENSPDNLLYGAGIHVCPGAPLARMQLTILTTRLLAATSGIEASPETPERATFPEGGYAALWVRLT